MNFKASQIIACCMIQTKQEVILWFLDQPLFQLQDI